MNAGNRLIECDGRPGADGPFGGQSHVRDQEVRAGFRHGLRLGFIEDVRAGEQVQFMRACNHLNFLAVSHAGFLQILAEKAIDQPHGGEVLHSGKAELFQIAKKQVHDAKRIGSTNASQHRNLANDGQYFARHLQDDGIGVAVGHEAGQGSSPGHTVAARIVNDDEVGACGFGALGGDSSSRAGAQDGCSPGAARSPSVQPRRSVHHFSLETAWITTPTILPWRPLQKGNVGPASFL